MDINFKQKFNTPTEQLIRRCGYGLVRDHRATQRSYARRMGQGFYPRFHMYVNSEDPLILSIHIDQKQASYEGTTAHGGDYDSEYVKKEADRIYNTVMSLSQGREGLQGLEGGDGDEDDKEEGGFFGKLFGK